jgi:cytochrome P450
VVLERTALKDTTLPDGRVIPRGSHIMVDSTDLWNPAVYPSPDEFDARRFLRKREEGDKASQFVQSSPAYNVFGGGRHICPGRFLASNELKLVLSHILLKYDIRLAEGCEPKNIQYGFYTIGDPSVQLEVKRRDASTGDLLA